MTPCGALAALMDFTRCTSTSGAAMTFSENQRHAPSSRRSTTPAIIHRVAHLEGPADGAPVRSMRRFFSSASIEKLNFAKRRQNLFARGHASREQSADRSKDHGKQDTFRHARRCDMKVEGRFGEV